MKVHGRNSALLLLATLFVLACDASTLFAGAPIPTPNPDVVNTVVAMTAAAAGTQTAVVNPPTLTPTLTPFPSQTPVDTPLPTATFSFASTYVPPTAVSTGDVTSSADLDCHIQGQIPANGTSESRGTKFVTTWTVENSGTMQWLHSNIDIVFTGGKNMASYPRNNTGADVPPGGSTQIKITMTAPASSGTYSSRWMLVQGKTYFCLLSVTISVQ